MCMYVNTHRYVCAHTKTKTHIYCQESLCTGPSLYQKKYSHADMEIERK